LEGNFATSRRKTGSEIVLLGRVAGTGRLGVELANMASNGALRLGGYRHEDLSVTVTEQGGGEPKTASANATVASGGGKLLEVLTIDTTGIPKTVVASSNTSNKAKLLNKVQLRLKDPDSKGLHIRLRRSAEKADEMPAVLRVTGLTVRGVSLTLRREGSTTTFSGNVTRTQLGQLLQEAPANAFTIGNGWLDKRTNILPSVEQRLKSFGPEYGRLQYLADPVGKNEVEFDNNNFAAAGYEPLTAEVDGLSADLNAENQVPLFLINAHGDPNGNLDATVEGTGGSFVMSNPSAVGGALDFKGYSRLKALLLMSCSSGRIHSYHRSEEQPKDPAAGGVQWADNVKAISGIAPRPTVILAYNGEILNLHIRDALFKFFESSPFSSRNYESFPKQWILSNAAAYQAKDSDAACAVAPNGDYWCVRYVEAWKTTFRFKYAEHEYHHKHRTIVQVPLAKWKDYNTPCRPTEAIVRSKPEELPDIIIRTFPP
jgi:hypothetical protein